MNGNVMVDAYNELKNELITKMNLFSNIDNFDYSFLNFAVSIAELIKLKEEINGTEFRILLCDTFNVKYAAPDHIKLLLYFNYPNNKSYNDYVQIKKGGVKPNNAERLIKHKHIYNIFIKVKLGSFIFFKNYFRIKKIEKRNCIFVLDNKYNINNVIDSLNYDLDLIKKNTSFSSNKFNIKQFTTYKNSLHLGHSVKKEETLRLTNPQEKEVFLLHNRMQNIIYNQLKKKYGNNNVATEVPDGFGSNIDIILSHKDNYFLYEIKTETNIKKCIRQALSQLLEYAYWGNKKHPCVLIIIGNASIDDDKEAQAYLLKLRTDFSIPVYYQRFNLENEFLEEKMY